MANAFALWSTAVVVTKLLIIRHGCHIAKCNDSDIHLSHFLKNFEVLESTVFTPLNQVFFDEYETTWIKEIMQQTEQTQDDDNNYEQDTEEENGNSKTKNTYEYTQWVRLMKKIKQSPAAPIDPFHHFARCLIVINTYIYRACTETDIGPKTIGKIVVWFGYMKEILNNRKHKVIEHFDDTLQKDFIGGLQELRRLIADKNQQHNGDEYSFFSPGVLLIRALTSTHTGQERSDFRHGKSEIWIKQSELILWDIILGENSPTRLMDADDDELASFKCPFINQLPIRLCTDPAVISAEHHCLENMFEATLNWFEAMTMRCTHNPDSSARSYNVMAERNVVTDEILGCGIISRTCENTDIRKQRNTTKAKTSKSEIKKVDRSRTREYRGTYPVNAIKKNSYIFGEELLKEFLSKIPNQNKSYSGQKRKCPVCPTEDDLPFECV